MTDVKVGGSLLRGQTLLSVVVDRFKSLTNATARDTRMATERINEIGGGNLSNYRVWGPEGLQVDMGTYLKVLLSVSNALVDIQKTNLDPLIRWSGKITSDPEYIKLVWIELSDMGLVAKDLKGSLLNLYDSSIGDEPFSTPFNDLYPNPLQLTDCTLLLEQLTINASVLMSKDIQQYIGRTTELVDGVLSNPVNIDFFQTSDTAKVARVKDYINNTGELIELLAIVVFQINAANNAHQKNIEKINKEL